MSKEPHRIIQLQRTRRGVCARCGQDFVAHHDGNCPGGKGSYTWAQTRAESEQMIANLEAFIAAAKGN